MGSIICLFQLILQANPLFCFQLWYSSCYEVKSWFHTFPKWCSHTPMRILILLDNRDCHANLVQPVCLSSSGSDHVNIRKINYQFFSTLFVSFVPNCLCFYRPPTLFPQGLRCLNQASILWIWSLPILFRQYSYPVVLVKMLYTFIILNFFSPVEPIQALLIISFPRFKYLLFPVHLLIFPVCYSIVPECWRYLEDSCFHSAFVQKISRMLSHSSHLTQPVQSIF